MDTAIHIDKVSKKLGTRQVLQDVTFDVQTGDIFGYLGGGGGGAPTAPVKRLPSGYC